MRRLRKIVLVVLAVLVALTAVAALVVTAGLRGSLPRLEGEVALEGLAGPVTVARDDLGVPDIDAVHRRDAALVLGYLHGQERFFQMDMQRRLAAGELAALLGPALLDTDRDHRRHGFRALAGQVVAAASPDDRALLDAYAAGVNAGLTDLRARPWEYWLLRQKPAPWRPEDTLLCMYAMWVDLSLSVADDEKNGAVARDILPPPAIDLLFPWGNRWEAPLQTEPVPGVVIPDSADLDIRHWTFAGQAWSAFRDSLRELGELPQQDTAGSNNWAVAGPLTGHGGALLASDMHLGLSLPNTWYRARIRWTDAAGAHDLVGVTLPGTPLLIAGSNGRVAWGFTNSYGDWADLVILAPDSTDARRYLTPDGPRAFEVMTEIIEVAGAPADTLRFDRTIWGPVWAADVEGRRLALRWTAHDPAAVNMEMRGLETAATVDEAVAVAARSGIPPQNLVCADADGRIAWTIIGAIPRRVGWDGRLPVSWADGTCRWDGYHGPDEWPGIVDPAEGRLWTANNRVAAGEDLAKIGNGVFATGARARQIRDGLRALDRPVEADMLALQLDDRALFVQEWRDLALAVLHRHPPDPGGPRAEFQRWVTERWEGRAIPESVSYRLARGVMWNCVDGALEPLLKPCAAAAPDFRDGSLPHRLAVAWELIARQPPHLLPPWFADWDDVVLQAIDRVMTQAGADPAAFTWGAHHDVVVQHPFVRLEPRLARWLAVPRRALPGDSFLPRVQGRTSGASQRMVVSPGREEDGIFHMPGGQSGHPLSPHFTRGHGDWEEGRPTPLLPGPAAHTLRLVPESG